VGGDPAAQSPQHPLAARRQRQSVPGCVRTRVLPDDEAPRDHAADGAIEPRC
jgi:hypothetical protein